SMNMSKATITRMILNVAIDSVIGAIPILGDMFDIFWRANLKNTALMEKELANPRGQKQRSVLWLLMMIAILVALFYVCVVLPITMIF
ncbi:MAG: DUF4112 domain-containing protein, partial [Bacteriovoracaceae bacterium]|nr:DUF4112 domain-containing protein [Bacteriovoracaceae bacterium]